ncbi:cupin domain-containing protein [Vibrio ostreicida]|uniref:Cupin domain-containing protein n=1 Tax=Vibrio ostreicida TaxID=526588 RepID=A0ABT8C1H9_9VIBR|nr:cupin domain-containing protein [Vibrio ostreicida]MDN3612187.1 cupin domain-containing protein [Vibrio ostreicida]NPD08582.1 cupin [Vibrio ostreicida]
MLNMNFSERVVVDTESMSWLASPANGVWRKPLERQEAESGHTTSIVRYDAGCSFKTHHHPFGEEIFVLDGVFSDENGHYPAGSYLRHPPGSHHAPFSAQGCTIWVKLNQFNHKDHQTVKMETRNRSWLSDIEGFLYMPLHQFENQHVILVRWSAKECPLLPRHFGGGEILVIAGTLADEYGHYPTGTWIRTPQVSTHFPLNAQTTTILVKTGHLPISN